MTTTTTDTTLGRALPTEMLERFRARAPQVGSRLLAFEPPDVLGTGAIQ